MNDAIHEMLASYQPKNVEESKATLGDIPCIDFKEARMPDVFSFMMIL